MKKQKTKKNSFANNHRKSPILKKKQNTAISWMKCYQNHCGSIQVLPSVYIIFKLYLIYSTQLVFFPCKRKLTCHATPQQPLICKEQ